MCSVSYSSFRVINCSCVKHFFLLVDYTEANPCLALVQTEESHVHINRKCKGPIEGRRSEHPILVETNN